MAAGIVAIASGDGGYPGEAPYSPGHVHSEYPFDLGARPREANPAYDRVRDVLHLLGFDEERYGRKEWNPLGEIIRPGNTVLLKPNFVRDFRETHSGDDDCLITHGSIIRATVDYVYIALAGKGRIIIADAPQNDADFDAIRRMAGLSEIQAFYRDHTNLEIEVYDLRTQKARKSRGVIVGHEQLPGDPAGYVRVNLGQRSMFSEVEHRCHLLYGSEYDTSEIRRHHTTGLHEYLISKTVLDADCVINLAKLKTHKKTGITACMKNLVGINGNKNWLPHHRLGTPSQGGDQFADDAVIHRIERGVMGSFRRVFPLLGPMRAIAAKPLKGLGQRVFGDTNAGTIRSGNWYGNDTTWRMVLDLDRLFMYADANGHLREAPARCVFCFVDGIVGGEGDGPLNPTPKPAGVVLGGTNPAAVDLACARLMGFDYKQLPVLYRALEVHPLSIAPFEYEDVMCRSNRPEFNRRLREFDREILPFEPPSGWRSHVELHAM